MHTKKVCQESTTAKLKKEKHLMAQLNSDKIYIRVIYSDCSLISGTSLHKQGIHQVLVQKTFKNNSRTKPLSGSEQIKRFF